MSDQIFYFRGNPAAFGLSEPGQAMIADLELIGDLTVEQIDRLTDNLREATGFLGPKSLKERIDSVISDDKTAKAVLRTLQHFDPDDVEPTMRKLDHARQSGNADGLDDAKVVNVRKNLSKLIAIYPALSRYEKAEWLSKLTGQQLNTANLICDLRPIFDVSGTVIEGMVPYTRLRLVTTGADGLPREFEAELSVKQVYELFDSAKKAKTKLATLLASVDEWIPNGSPDLPATRVPKGAGENG